MHPSSHILRLTLFALLALVGCQDDLPQATEIVHTRILGARAEVVGDEARATPEPGGRATLRYDVVFPGLDQDASSLRSLLIQCTFPPRYTGVPLCKEVADFAL